jgi:hypothetical protein
MLNVMFIYSYAECRYAEDRGDIDAILCVISFRVLSIYADTEVNYA